MKLELKHLAPYLPYELKIQWQDGKEYTLTGRNILATVNDCIRPRKLILCPLSDLTKEIECKGDIIKPINELSEWLYNSEGENFDDVEGAKNWIEAIRRLEGGMTINLPYKVVEKLFEMHFDVFGLIEKGLAIDINTVKK